MKATPKLDEVAARLKYAANLFSFMPVYVNRMDTGDFEGVEYAMKVLDGIEKAWKIAGKNAITPKDVENELLEMYPDITDIPKSIAVIGTKFNQVGLPVDVGSYADKTNENVQRLNNISQIPINLRNGITLCLSLWDDYCQMWVVAVKNIISNLSEYAENYKKVLTGNITPDKPQQVQASTPLPVELQTDEAIRYIDKAKKLGLIDDNGHWLKGLQMLACFARDMSIKLHLGKGERIAWQPFEKYFGIEKGRLRLNYNDIQKTGQTPTDIYLIDKVFE